MDALATSDPNLACVEHAVWTPVPTSGITAPQPTDHLALTLAAVAPDEHDRIVATGTMSWHMVGCTGNYGDHQAQELVAATMAAQLAGDTSHEPGTAVSFMYHLGDVVYRPDTNTDAATGTDTPDLHLGHMYNDQFYIPYTRYTRPIFAIPGNHDGKHSPHHHKSAIDHFLDNFCARSPSRAPDNSTDGRRAMTQPYVYWRLDTPLAYIIGLNANIANGGILDEPTQAAAQPQYDWLVAQLRHVAARNAQRPRRKAVLLAVHYPPYSSAANFVQRGDPTLGPTNATAAQPLGMVLQRAFAASGEYPDAVCSAHAHLYQRLTYRYADGREVPYLIAGSGGHSLEKLGALCNGALDPLAEGQAQRGNAVMPPHLALPPGDGVQLVAYNDMDYGFLRLTIASETQTLTGEFFTAAKEPTATPSRPYDRFTLDLRAHRLIQGG